MDDNKENYDDRDIIVAESSQISPRAKVAFSPNRMTGQSEESDEDSDDILLQESVGDLPQFSQGPKFSQEGSYCSRNETI